MKFTLSWLKDHLDTDASLDAILTKLTALGLEVEGVEDRSKELAPFVIGHVLSADQHPNADKLRLCLVDVGSGAPVQVVCGAPNARTGIKVVFAPPGTTVPATGAVLKIAPVRGVESRGMMCSERELKLSDSHDGIIELPADAPVGAPFAGWAGLGDPVIDISLTPDRADCAGVRGVARDLAAAGLGRLKPLDSTPVPPAFKSDFTVRLEATEGCPYFVGRHIRGVKNGESPKWLKDKLTAIGLRPISALVDVTNFLTFDDARPAHVFDTAKVRGGGLIVRLAKPGETLAALNNKTYTLDETMTVIADHERPEALAGVIGGEESGCTATTDDVFLEIAWFDSVRTARTGRKLGIDTDARYRFERGVDPAPMAAQAERATRLILEMCGGEPSELIVAGAPPAWRREIVLRPDRVETLGGVSVPVAEQKRILADLGFELVDSPDGAITAVPPGWRADVFGEADLVEEVLRVVGYDRIPVTPLPRSTVLTKPAVSVSQRRVFLAKRALAARGLMEAVTWSFMSGETASLFGQVDPGLRLSNPISSDLDVMRPSILPNLIQAAGRNADRGFPDVGLFEVGPSFRDPTPNGEDTTATGIRAGAAVPRHWAERTRPVDVFDAKADALGLLEALGAPMANIQVSTDAPEWYHPGRSGCLRLGPSVLARFGEIHPSVLSALGVKGPVVGFEVFLDALPAPKKKGGTARPKLQASAFQPIFRDFAFVLDRGVEVDRVVRAVKGADKVLVKDVSVFDVYAGDKMEAGKKSVAVSVELQPTDRTLTDQELETIAAKIVAAVAKSTGGALRA